jgi:hypothetical protein
VEEERICSNTVRMGSALTPYSEYRSSRWQCERKARATHVRFKTFASWTAGAAKDQPRRGSSLPDETTIAALREALGEAEQLVKMQAGTTRFIEDNEGFDRGHV